MNIISPENLSKILTALKRKVQTMVDEKVVTKTSQLNNDSKYQTDEDVKKYVTSVLADVGVKIEIVESLPKEKINEKIMYLVLDPNSSTETGNIYNEYLYINNKWELIGSTKTNIEIKGMTPEEENEFIAGLWK